MQLYLITKAYDWAIEQQKRREQDWERATKATPGDPDAAYLADFEAGYKAFKRILEATRFARENDPTGGYTRTNNDWCDLIETSAGPMGTPHAHLKGMSQEDPFRYRAAKSVYVQKAVREAEQFSRWGRQRAAL